MAIEDVVQLPERVHRRKLAHEPRKRRLCRDNRAYTTVPYTITPTASVGVWGPMWRADRNYWIAKVTANAGTHDGSTHPNDGCPIGSAITLNLHRVLADLSNDTLILGNNQKIEIAAGHHQDVANDSENGLLQEGDFNITQLSIGDHVYPEVYSVGSSSPGGPLVVSLVLVPVR
jgi:hypothetical protein